MICRFCKDEINQFNSGKFTYIDQCKLCKDEIEDIQKYLGFNDGQLNKMTSISVYRGNNKETRKKISNQKARTGMA